MMITRNTVTMVAIAAAMVGLAGCASQKEPAEQAVAAIEKTLEGSSAQLQEFLPERYQEMTGKVAALRESLAQQKYRDVVAEAPAVADELRRAVADSAIRRAQILLAMEDEWTDLAKTMPAMIAAVDKKLAVLGSRPPKGMDREAYKALVKTYDAARESWNKAATTVDSAKFESTVMAAREAKTAIVGVMNALGVKVS